MRRGTANTGGRATPWLSHGAASLQWLGEVKAPDNISIVAPAALLGCRCFSGRYACRIFRENKCRLTKCDRRAARVGSTRTSGPSTAGLCPFGAVFLCAVTLPPMLLSIVQQLFLFSRSNPPSTQQSHKVQSSVGGKTKTVANPFKHLDKNAPYTLHPRTHTYNHEPLD